MIAERGEGEVAGLLVMRMKLFAWQRIEHKRNGHCMLWRWISILKGGAVWGRGRKDWSGGGVESRQMQRIQ